MKKVLILLGAIIQMVMSSCKKEIVCHCGNGVYSSDGKNIYFEYKSNGAGLLPFSYTVKKELGADVKTFECIREGYVRDKDYLFYGTMRLDSIDVNSFEIIDFYYVKDKNNVYSTHLYQPLLDVDATTFSSYKLNIYTDKNNVYARVVSGLMIIEGADTDTFESFNLKVHKDKNHVFIGYKPYNDIDVETLTYDEKNDVYYDKNGSYKLTEGKLKMYETQDNLQK